MYIIDECMYIVLYVLQNVAGCLLQLVSYKGARLKTPEEEVEAAAAALTTNP